VQCNSIEKKIHVHSQGFLPYKTNSITRKIPNDDNPTNSSKIPSDLFQSLGTVLALEKRLFDVFTDGNWAFVY
jgi:hypothetical protein